MEAKSHNKIIFLTEFTIVGKIMCGHVGNHFVQNLFTCPFSNGLGKYASLQKIMLENYFKEMKIAF